MKDKSFFLLGLILIGIYYGASSVIAEETTTTTTTTIPEEIYLTIQGNDYNLCPMSSGNCSNYVHFDMTTDYYVVIEQAPYEYFSMFNLIAITTVFIGLIIAVAFISLVFGILVSVISGFISKK